MKKFLLFVFVAAVCFLFAGCDSTPSCPICLPPQRDTIRVNDTVYISDNYAIETVEDLVELAQIVNSGNSLPKTRIRLGNDLDLSTIENWIPIGASQENPFSGIFDGQGHTISGLTINAPEQSNNGLFGFATKAEIYNVKMTNASVIGYEYVAALVGRTDNSIIQNCSVENISLEATYWANGGLVGALGYQSNVSKCYAVSVSVKKGIHNGGGLIGSIGQESVVSNSYALNCDVLGSYDNFGVLFGTVGTGEIKNCYAVGSVNTPSQQVDGLGWNSVNSGIFTNNYYSSTVNGTHDGLELSQMQQQSTYVDWDFENIWEISPDKNGGFPTLRN